MPCSEPPSHYLNQLHETSECYCRIHDLITLYTELEKRLDTLKLKIASLPKK